jgi:2-oxo-4-hydroxy-4-carboxy-5-ureidoimidazoline decarboxylase
VNATLERFNALPPGEARQELLACCASTSWAGQLAARRPYVTLDDLRTVSATIFDDLGWNDVLQALDAHPRIGERAQGRDTEAQWSEQEQSAAATTEQAERDELIARNVEYERRFGHVFLIFATGKSAAEILANVRGRLSNDEVTERGVVRDELRKIADLRLRKWFDA